MPISSGNFQTNGQYSFKDRYVILIGGYQQGTVYHPNGTTSPPYGQAGRMCPTGVTAAGCHQGCSASASIVNKTYMGPDWKNQYENDVFVYDALTRVFGTVRATSTSDPSLMPAGCGGFPIDDNVPQVGGGCS